jgi:hypothetical protein
MGTNHEVTLEVLRSGFTNQLNTSAGAYTTYGESGSSSSMLTRAAFAAILDYSAHGGGTKIYANDPFFQTYKDLKLSINSGPCTGFVKADGSFDSGGATIFRNAGGYIQLTVTTIGGIRYALHIDSGVAGIYTDCFYSPETSCGGVPYKVVIDESTGQLAIKTIVSACSYSSCSIPISCLNICPASFNKITQVVTANAQTFDLTWPYDTTIYKPKSNANPYESGIKGKWRPLSNYVYRDTIISANTGTERNYKNAGVFEMEKFNWKNPSLNDASANAKWIKTSTVTKYSPDGNGLEEQDIFGIYSTAKFGYSKTQPYVVATNADYNSVQFESFEKAYSVYGNQELEDAWLPAGISSKRVNTYAHAGKYSWKLAANDSLLLKPLTLTQQMYNNGVSLKVWVNDTAVVEGTALKARLKMPATVVNYEATKIATVGNWTLYEMKVTNLSAFYVGAILTPVIINNYALNTIWVDDVRFQPLDAKVMAYVYDINTLRLIATFDDQHFGMFYQYNGEGKLLRKQIETERGLKTVTETQYHAAQQKVR